MDRLKAAAVGLAIALAVAGCSGDDETAPTTTQAPSSADHSPTTQEPNTGGIEVPDIPGTFTAAIPSLGFGIAVPEGWQATVLSDEAIERLEAATLAQPSFVEAARNVAASGAVFYAAGIDDEGRVSELKVDVQDGADTSPAGVAALARSVAESGKVQDVSIVDDLEQDRVRVDYRLAADPDAAHGDGEAIDTIGSQLFVPDGDRVWSFIVTSEDSASQDALLAIFEASITF
ncbi:hypothetical protein [Actinospongicola halichondriae]|uniref:hypothetical protein n=1 Tax=Actinospongicola halichondriae TaxID=3236844 RepID=UPI003D4A28A3